MDGKVYFYSALSIFVFFSLIAIIRMNIRHKKNYVLKPVNFLMIGVFFACTVMFLPVYSKFFGQGAMTARSVLLSVHNSIRLFVVDADYEMIAAYTAAELAGTYKIAFETFFAVLYCLAPMLTFGFVLSLFKNISAYLKLFRRYFRDIYVFSELNERSLVLATDIFNSDKKAVIVFADLLINKDSTNDLIECAEELGAIIFSKSVSAINFSFHSSNKQLVFFIMSDDEEENATMSWDIFERYKDKSCAELYLFSKTKQSELFLDCINKKHNMKIRRIIEPTSLINEYLYDKGHIIFDTANSPEKFSHGYKVISAVVIGMGTYGMEMAKTLPWFCQMKGYYFKLNVFDASDNAEARFKALCPEFLDPKCNGVFVEGEAQYDIIVKGETDYRSYDFYEKLKNIKDISFVFIALGSDEDNIHCATTVRMYCERIGIHPHITAVVYDKNKADRIKNAMAADGKLFDIEYTGSLKEIYSKAVIINSVLEEKALAVHMKYPAKNKTIEEHKSTFYTNEYNYNASCASAIHNKIRIDCKIAGAEKSEEQLTEEEKHEISIIEHRRWNAYTRSCGYIYSGSPDKSSRNDLAKLHNCLIPYDELSDEYKQIDEIVGIKK